MGLRIAVACLVLAAAPARAAAQDEAEPRAAQALRASLHEQAVAATAIYAVSAALGTAALITADLGLVGQVFYPDASTAALFYGGIVAGAVGFVMFWVGLALDVDRHSRRDALDRAEVRVTLAPGGLALAF